MVVVSGPKLVDELRRAADDELSFAEAANEVQYTWIIMNVYHLTLSPQSLQIRYTASPGIETNLYHVPLVRSQLTRSLYVLFPEIRDEVVTACNDQILASDGTLSCLEVGTN